MTIKITGTGSALPEKIVTNFDLEKLVETSDEWIQKRTGIAERRISDGETVSTLAADACRKALEMAGKSAEDVDLILVATCSPELLLPCCACQVQELIGASGAAAFDLNAACSGFLFALNTAYAYLHSGICQNVLGARCCRSLWTGRIGEHAFYLETVPARRSWRRPRRISSAATGAGQVWSAWCRDRTARRAWCSPARSAR